MRLFVLCSLFAASSLFAKGAEFLEVHSADGTKTMRIAIMEIGRDGDTLKIRREDGPQRNTRFSAFLDSDRQRIEEHYRKHVDASYLPPGGKRFGWKGDPAERLKKLGKDQEIEVAVARSLQWMKESQGEKGQWGERFPVALTSFALLSLSRHGETMDSAEYGDTVRAGLEYLLSVAKLQKGLVCSTRDRNISYEHAIAMWSIAELVNTHRLRGSGDDAIVSKAVDVLEKGVPFIVKGQTEVGGWLYTYSSNGSGDMSVGVWNLLALDAARRAIGSVPGSGRAIEKAGKFLELCATADGGYKYRGRDSDPGKWSLIGNGLTGHIITGTKPPHRERAIKWLFEKPFTGENVRFYSRFLQAEALSRIGGEEFTTFERDILSKLRGLQAVDGAWEIPYLQRDVNAQEGSILSTLFATLALQTSYR